MVASDLVHLSGCVYPLAPRPAVAAARPNPPPLPPPRANCTIDRAPQGGPPTHWARSWKGGGRPPRAGHRFLFTRLAGAGQTGGPGQAAGFAANGKPGTRRNGGVWVAAWGDDTRPGMPPPSVGRSALLLTHFLAGANQHDQRRTAYGRAPISKNVTPLCAGRMSRLEVPSSTVSAVHIL